MAKLPTVTDEERTTYLGKTVKSGKSTYTVKSVVRFSEGGDLRLLVGNVDSILGNLPCYVLAKESEIVDE